MNPESTESNPVWNENSPAPATIDSVDPWEIVQAAAALAGHFERLGMHFLPSATEAGVAEWAELLEQNDVSPDTAPIVAAPETRPSATAIRPAEPPAPKAAPRAGALLPSPPMPSRLQGVDTVIAAKGDYPGTALPVVERQSQLAEYAAVVSQCTRCSVLAKCRKQTVFGEGNATPRVVFFGEAPGADEDRLGRPFVGQAGQLLDKMIQACTFRREDVYILNTVKCRPPENRNPEPGEVQNCREYFEAQLQILRPDYIVCLGAVSTQALLASTLSVGRLRGRFHQYYSSKVVATYHPAYLLRNPSAKKAAWEDLQMLMRDMGITPKR